MSSHMNCSTGVSNSEIENSIVKSIFYEHVISLLTLQIHPVLPLASNLATQIHHVSTANTIHHRPCVYLPQLVDLVPHVSRDVPALFD